MRLQVRLAPGPSSDFNHHLGRPLYKTPQARIRIGAPARASEHADVADALGSRDRTPDVLKAADCAEVAHRAPSSQ